jgi:hypothetical protein
MAIRKPGKVVALFVFIILLLLLEIEPKACHGYALPLNCMTRPQKSKFQS